MPQRKRLTNAELYEQIKQDMTIKLFSDLFKYLDKVSEQQETLLSYTKEGKNFLGKLVTFIEEYKRPTVLDGNNTIIQQTIKDHIQLNSPRTNTPIDFKDRVPPELITYDWWQLANEQYAKIFRVVQYGHVFTEDGLQDTYLEWNPLNNRCLTNNSFDMMRRKTGDNQKGWPEWTK